MIRVQAGERSYSSTPGDHAMTAAATKPTSRYEGCSSSNGSVRIQRPARGCHSPLHGVTVVTKPHQRAWLLLLRRTEKFGVRRTILTTVPPVQVLHRGGAPVKGAPASMRRAVDRPDVAVGRDRLRRRASYPLESYRRRTGGTREAAREGCRGYWHSAARFGYWPWSTGSSRVHRCKPVPAAGLPLVVP